MVEQEDRPVSYSRRWRLWYLAYIFSNMSSGLLNPMIPLFISLYFRENVVFVGIASSLASLSSVIALILWGNISDNVKKRKVFVLIGFLGSFASLLLVMFSTTIFEYIGILVMYQFFAMASVPVSTLLVIENEHEAQWSKTVSVFSAISTVGTVGGLGLGLLIVIKDPSSIEILKIIYMISAFIYLVAFILAYFLLKESSVKLRRSSILGLFSIRTFERTRYAPSYVFHIVRLFGRKKGIKTGKMLMLYIILSGVLMVGFQIFFTPYPVMLIDKYNANESMIYTMYLLNSAFSVVSYNLSGWYINKVSLQRAIYIPLAIRMIVFAATAIIPFFGLFSFNYLIMVVLIYGGLGFVWSFIGITQITSVTKMADKYTRGRAIGYYNSILGVGQIIGAFISGYIVTYIGYSGDFVFATLMVGIGFIGAMKVKAGVAQDSSKMNKKTELS
ncbi:MAG: MFS transporter [Cuniculiplasma sp.]